MTKRLALVGVAVLVATGLATASPPTAAAPQAGPSAQDVAVPGLEGPVEVVTDRHGVAHIRATTEHDAFFMQGWVHAHDRLFQMDLSRRQALGTSAELLGPDALPDDEQLRMIGIGRGAQRSLEAYGPETLAVGQAYADGVNAFAGSHPLPPEYAAIEISEFRPWTLLDSAAVGKLIAFGLSFDLDVDRTLDRLAYQAAGEAHGFDGDVLFSEDVFRTQPFTDASTVPDATGTSPAGETAGGTASAAAGPVPAEAAAGMVELGRRFLDSVDGIPLFDEARSRSEAGNGSNEWGVAGSLTPSGRPIIANDPHLALDQPSTFYPLGIEVEGGMNVVGKTFPGAPTVILGHNRHIEWGATTNPLDVTDAYLESIVEDPTSPSGLSTVYQGQNEHVEEIVETFRTNIIGNGTNDDADVTNGLTWIVPRRNNGPIVQLLGSQALSIQYAGFSGTRELEVFLTWNRAENLDDFREGLQFFDVGSQNWAYADTAGNLGYFTSGELPLREDLEAGTVHFQAPWFIRDGTGGNEWIADPNPGPAQALPYEVLPFEEMPQVLNPSEGFFVNANNDPAGTTLDNDPLDQQRPSGGIYYLNVGYDGYRGGRITQRIRQEVAGDGELSFADIRDIQGDTVLVDSQFFVPYLQRAFQRAQTSGVPELAALGADPGVEEAVLRFGRWDGSTPTGIFRGYDAVDERGRRSSPTEEEVLYSTAATIYSTWRGQYVGATVDRTLAGLDNLPTPGSDEAVKALRNLLENFDERAGQGASGVDFFADPTIPDPADRRDIWLLRPLRAALDLLASDTFAPAFHGSTDQDDYRWGRLHRFVLDHPLGPPYSVPPAGGDFPPQVVGLTGIATDGGFNTVDASSHSARSDGVDEFMFGGGPVRRFVGRADPGGIRAVSSLPGGTSARLGSPFYSNLLLRWLTNEAQPQQLNRSAYVEGNAGITVYVPG